MSDPLVGKFDRDSYDQSILMISDGLMIPGADEIVLQPKYKFNPRFLLHHVTRNLCWPSRISHRRTMSFYEAQSWQVPVHQISWEQSTTPSRSGMWSWTNEKRSMSDQSIEATSATQRDDTTAFAAQVEGMSVNSGSLISLFHAGWLLAPVWWRRYQTDPSPPSEIG